MRIDRSYVVIGVEDPGDILRQVSVQNSFDVITNVNWDTNGTKRLTN